MELKTNGGLAIEAPLLRKVPEVNNIGRQVKKCRSLAKHPVFSERPRPDRTGLDEAPRAGREKLGAKRQVEVTELELGVRAFRPLDFNNGAERCVGVQKDNVRTGIADTELVLELDPLVTVDGREWEPAEDITLNSLLKPQPFLLSRCLWF
jgi:hypothetical protein